MSLFTIVLTIYTSVFEPVTHSIHVLQTVPHTGCQLSSYTLNLDFCNLRLSKYNPYRIDINSKATDRVGVYSSIKKKKNVKTKFNNNESAITLFG